MSSLASLSEWPDYVKDIFLTSRTNDAGIVALRFFIRGKPWTIVVDDSLLFKTTAGELVFAK
jgi:hypothetical protein